MPGSKHWCFTSFKNVDDFESSVRKGEILYLVYGVEQCPTTKKTHLQGFVSFKNRTTLSRAKSALGDSKAHLETKRGTIREAADYCKKDGNFQEYGEAPPEQGDRGGEANKRRWHEALEHCKAGTIDEIDPELQIRYCGNIERLSQRFRARGVFNELLPGSICGLFLQGAPGLGKSFYAKQFCRERDLTFWIKPLNKWWDGYDQQSVVIIEDVDHFTAKHLGHSLKIWADETPFTGEVKGGTIKLRPILIIVTSNYPIRELWADDLVLQEAIKRRFFAPTLIRREDFGCIVWPENLSTIRNGSQKEIPQPSSSVSENTP